VFAGGSTGSISIFHYAEPKLIPLLTFPAAHPRGVVSMVLCPEHGLLYTGGNDKYLKCWRLVEGSLLEKGLAMDSRSQKPFSSCPLQGHRG